MNRIETNKEICRILVKDDRLFVCSHNRNHKELNIYSATTGRLIENLPVSQGIEFIEKTKQIITSADLRETDGSVIRKYRRTEKGDPDYDEYTPDFADEEWFVYSTALSQDNSFFASVGLVRG